MRRRLVLWIALAVVAAAAAGVLVAVAAAGDATTLPDLSASELIARMSDHSQAPQAISGDISWTNELFGELPFMPDHVALPAASPLTASGSGRVWAQDGKVRLESQGQGGDQVLVADAGAGTLWTYTFVDDTAHLYTWSAADSAGAGEEPTADSSPEALSPERVSGFLEAAARFMTVEVSGQAFVAGRDAYVLTMTPAATDTALGRVEAAIDGKTYVPLRLDVVAKGHDTPTLSFGFTRVSYEPVDDAVFAFTPPEGAKVERDTIDPKGDARGSGTDVGAPKAGAEDGTTPQDEGRADAMEQMKTLAHTALLTRPEAAELVDFPLAWARDSAARDFRWAYVFDEGMPVNALGTPVFELTGMPGLFGSGGDAAGDSPPATGPAAVLLYGEGFGSIVLAQTKTTADTREQLKQLPEVVDSIDVGGAPAKAVVTPLGSVVIWERDGVTLVAAGMVPRADMVAFVTSVR